MQQNYQLWYNRLSFTEGDRIHRALETKYVRTYLSISDLEWFLVSIKGRAAGHDRSGTDTLFGLNVAEVFAQLLGNFVHVFEGDALQRSGSGCEALLRVHVSVSTGFCLHQLSENLLVTIEHREVQ